MTANVITKWSAAQMVQHELTEEQKHNIFSGYARVVANSYMPWLFPLLDEAGATVYAEPGRFLFFFESDPANWHTVPELGALISMTPWPEPQEVVQ